MLLSFSAQSDFIISISESGCLPFYLSNLNLCYNVLLFPLPKSISLNRKSISNKGDLEYNSKLDLQSDLVRKSNLF